jgi:hypothetical protein
MADDRDGADDSGETVTKPGEGKRDEGQSFSDLESERMREFPGIHQPEPGRAESGDVVPEERPNE